MEVYFQFCSCFYPLGLLCVITFVKSYHCQESFPTPTSCIALYLHANIAQILTIPACNFGFTMNFLSCDPVVTWGAFLAARCVPFRASCTLIFFVFYLINQDSCGQNVHKVLYFKVARPQLLENWLDVFAPMSKICNSKTRVFYQEMKCVFNLRHLICTAWQHYCTFGNYRSHQIFMDLEGLFLDFQIYH